MLTLPRASGVCSLEDFENLGSQKCHLLHSKSVSSYIYCIFKPWKNEETCWKHVARNIRCGHMFPLCFPVLPHGKQCFRQQIYSAVEQKHTLNLLLVTMFPVWQNWETSGKHVPASNVSGNMFPCFAKLLSRFN